MNHNFTHSILYIEAENKNIIDEISQLKHKEKETYTYVVNSIF